MPIVVRLDVMMAKRKQWRVLATVMAPPTILFLTHPAPWWPRSDQSAATTSRS